MCVGYERHTPHLAAELCNRTVARGAMPPPGPVPMPPQMIGGMGGMGNMGQMGQMGSMGMGPFVPGDFRTPPFPGIEGECSCF